MVKRRIAQRWNGIVFRSLAAVTLITALLGGITSMLISMADNRAIGHK